MTITYEEFDSTPATVIAALKAKITANPHWTDQNVVAVQTTSTNQTTAAGTTVNLTSAAGFTPGQWITITGGGNENVVQISTVVNNTLTMASTWGFIFPTGSTVRTRNTVLKSVSDRGASLIVDLENASFSYSQMGFSVYRAWAGTAPGGQTDMKSYQLWWKPGVGTATMPLHVTLSVGKNHLFVSIEGPRSFEANPTSTTYGSMKTYFAVSDLVPYHAADTVPAVIAIGNKTYVPTVAASDHQCHISRDSTNTNSWTPGKLASLTFPSLFTTQYVPMPRDCSIDGNSYLFPYVLFSEAEGIRGRLSSFFFAGTTSVSTLDFPENVGTKVVFDGLVYKLLAVNKGDNSFDPWGPFGQTAQSSAVMRSIVVAVPCAVAV